MTLDTTHPIESKADGYIEIGHSRYGDTSGIGFGLYSPESPEAIREQTPHSTVTNVERARHLGREYHDYDIPPEAEIASQDGPAE